MESFNSQTNNLQTNGVHNSQIINGCKLPPHQAYHPQANSLSLNSQISQKKLQQSLPVNFPQKFEANLKATLQLNSNLQVLKTTDLKALTQDTLLENTKLLFNTEKQISDQILVYLSEINRRQVYTSLGYESLYKFLVEYFKQKSARY